MSTNAVDFRAALRRLAKAVVIVTTRYDGERFAMSATAVSEVSMDPPSILVCVNQTASLHAPLRLKAPFCINILEVSQEAVARRCGGAIKGAARFADAEWRDDDECLPFLVGAQASIACINDTAMQYGTHCIFIGQVTGVRIGGEVNPLVYCDGRYGRAAC